MSENKFQSFNMVVNEIFFPVEFLVFQVTRDLLTKRNDNTKSIVLYN